MSEPYCGYRIEIQISESPQNGGWKAAVSVEKHDGEGISVSRREFVPGVFETKNDAREAALLQGKRMVDQRIA